MWCISSWLSVSNGTDPAAHEVLYESVVPSASPPWRPGGLCCTGHQIAVWTLAR